MEWETQYPKRTDTQRLQPVQPLLAGKLQDKPNYYQNASVLIDREF